MFRKQATPPPVFHVHNIRLWSQFAAGGFGDGIGGECEDG